MTLATINNFIATTAGTAVALSATSIQTNWVFIQVLRSNAGRVYVGDSTVDNTNLRGITLEAPLPSMTLPFEALESRRSDTLIDLNAVFIDVDNTGEGVNIVYAQTVAVAPGPQTVQDLLDQIILMTQEDATFSSGFWTIAEIIDYINDVEKDFFDRSGCFKRQDTVGATAGDRVFLEPTDSMSIDRITFNQVPLHRTDRWMLDMEDRNWKNQPAGVPKQYHQDLLLTKRFEVDRDVGPVGQDFTLTYTILPTTLTTTTDPLNITPAFFHYILYGVLEKMLGKQGEGQDLGREKYCHARYEAGVAIVLTLMRSQKRSLEGLVAQTG
jgi:hypothetical protein